MSASLLIVDDEADIRNLVKGILEDEGYSIQVASNSEEAYASISTHPPQLIILDIWLQGSEQDGMEILETVKAKYPYIPVVMISGHGTIETAVSAIKKGAYDFIEKPFKADRLILMIQRALETAMLRQENEALKQKIVISDDLIGSSPCMQGLQQILKRVAPTNSRVLLMGEPGSGKDIAARFIHKHSMRGNKPYLALSCATLRPDRLEIELFGSEDGVMGEPGQTGVLEKANGGTLLLDEVADMPLETQGKIVRVLQNQTFKRVGGNELIHVDVRILASTNRDLEKEIEEGHFRQDLYYRLNVVPIHMPALKERSQDIPELVHYFAGVLASNSASPHHEFSEEAFVAMQGYHWPGNIRQLRNVVEWVMIMASKGHGESYDADDLPPEITGRSGVSRMDGGDSDGGLVAASSELVALSLREAREVFERDYLQAQIHRFGGNISKTAQFVGMERSALHRKLKSLDIAASDKDNSSVTAEKQALKTA